MLKKTIVPLAAGTLLQLSATASSFNLHLTLMGSYTVARNDLQVSTGTFDVRNRAVNLGFEVIHQRYLAPNLFVAGGIRYTSFKTTVKGTDPSGTMDNGTSPLTWERRYSLYAIPLYAGSDFRTAKGNHGIFFAGMSLGLMTTAFARDQISSVNTGTSGDKIVYTLTDQTDVNTTTFLPFVEFGARYQLFRKMPEFSFGVQCSFPLQKTTPEHYTATIRNESKNQSYDYTAANRLQLFSYMLTMSYQLGYPGKPQQHKNAMRCPS